MISILVYSVCLVEDAALHVYRMDMQLLLYFMESLDFLGGAEKTLCSCLENSVFLCVCMSENIMDITKWIIKRS